MKKYICFVAAALLTASCTKLPHVTFKGKAPGLTNAVFLVDDAAGNSIAGDNITNGTFSKDTVLENPGYGSFSINRNGVNDKNVFEIYLEAGEYTIEVDTAHLSHYPKITSSSQIQKELSAFNILQDEVRDNVDLLVADLEKKVSNVNPLSMTEKEYNVLLTRYVMAQNKRSQVKLQAFRDFLEQYPNSSIAARVMSTLEYKNDPQAYNAIYQKLSPAAKNSDEGKTIGENLKHLMQLLPGAKAPLIAGTTPDGKTFDPAKLDKKIYVVDFWKAGNEVSRYNHKEVKDVLMKHLKNDEVGYISISLDTRKNWWTTAIKDDKLTWTQYADLKGNESANVTNWMITTMPTYYLVDGQWNIVERDIALKNIELSVKTYLQKNKSHAKNFSL